MNLIKAAQYKNPDQPVLIAGDKSVKYEAVLSVMDELQRAQIKRVGLLVQTGSK
jgi:biopolymer transport protein TolR